MLSFRTAIKNSLKPPAIPHDMFWSLLAKETYILVPNI